jgi:hypothetical protein
MCHTAVEHPWQWPAHPGVCHFKEIDDMFNKGKLEVIKCRSFLFEKPLESPNFAQDERGAEVHRSRLLYGIVTINHASIRIRSEKTV